MLVDTYRLNTIKSYNAFEPRTKKKIMENNSTKINFVKIIKNEYRGWRLKQKELTVIKQIKIDEHTNQ